MSEASQVCINEDMLKNVYLECFFMFLIFFLLWLICEVLLDELSFCEKANHFSLRLNSRWNNNEFSLYLQKKHRKKEVKKFESVKKMILDRQELILRYELIFFPILISSFYKDRFSVLSKKVSQRIHAVLQRKSHFNKWLILKMLDRGFPYNYLYTRKNCLYTCGKWEKGGYTPGPSGNFWLNRDF